MYHRGGMVGRQGLKLKRLWTQLLHLPVSPLRFLVKVELFDGDKLVNQLPGLVLAPVELLQKLVCLVLQVVVTFADLSVLSGCDFAHSDPILLHLFRQVLCCEHHIGFGVV